MRIAYLGKIQLSDVDLSYLKEAQKLSDMTYIMEITPRFVKGPAYNISSVYPKSGVFKAVDIYPEFTKYADFIDIDKFYIVNTYGKLWQIKAFYTNLLLLIFLIRNKFSVIHVTWPLNIYEFILYFLRKKMLLTVHDPFPHTGLDTFIVRLRRKVAFWLIPKLIILNQAQREEFISYYKIDPSRLIDSRMSSYTYLQSIKPNTESPVLPDKPFILFSGKISPYKGVDYLLPAMIKVHERFPKTNLIVAGGGKYHFNVEPYKKLDYIDIRNCFIPEDELVALMKSSLFMICPYTDATQSGVIMSAFAFAKPVIATNVGGLPEMVIDNKYGLIVKEKDVDALADSICLLLQKPELVKYFSEEISKNYGYGELSWKKIAEELRNEYEIIDN